MDRPQLLLLVFFVALLPSTWAEGADPGSISVPHELGVQYYLEEYELHRSMDARIAAETRTLTFFSDTPVQGPHGQYPRTGC